MITNQELEQILSDLQPWIYDTSVDEVMHQRQDFANLLRYLGPDGLEFRSKDEVKQVLLGWLNRLKDNDDPVVKALKHMLGDIAADLDIELAEPEEQPYEYNPLNF